MLRGIAEPGRGGRLWRAGPAFRAGLLPWLGKRLSRNVDPEVDAAGQEARATRRAPHLQTQVPGRRAQRNRHVQLLAVAHDLQLQRVAALLK